MWGKREWNKGDTGEEAVLRQGGKRKMSRIARSSDGDEKSIVGKNVGVEDAAQVTLEMC